MKKTLTLLYLWMLTVVAMAQQITGRAPSQVAVGEQFRLSYTVNTDDVSGFRAGNIPDAFEVLMGPSTSTQSSFQMVNGHTSSSTSVTYTYILSATKNGSFTIPAAHATVNGKALHSNELRIKVSGTAQQGNNGGTQRPQGGGQARAAGSHISGSDLFIKVSANKSHVHEQEPILLTYKVYTLVDLTSLSGKMPDLKSFYTREVPLPQEKSFKLETLNGRPYRTVTWQQYVMFPQTTGKLEIPSITYEGMVVLQNRNVDPFEAFFNGGSGYMEVKKEIKAPGLTITVDPLPARPTNFSGGVGTFTLTANIDKKEVKANDPITFRVTVGGTGNLKLIKQPVVNLPKDFDQYDAKITDNTKLTTNGIEGSMVYDILVVPRHQGKYEVPPVEFTYYDTSSNSYKTLRSQPFTLDVAKGDGSSSVSAYTSEEVKQLNKDIRYIKTEDIRLREVDDYFFGSAFYWISLAVLLAVFISLFVIFRHRAIENANIGKMRGKRANKVAVRRLREANKLLKAGKQNEFYDEVLRALWGYVGDKLDMPVTQLSRDNISQQLTERGVDTDTVNQFIGALDECEYARYAPGDASGNMNKVYDAAIQAIMKIEDFLKGKKHIRRSAVPVLLLMLMMPLSASAVTKAEADSAYVHERYQQAIADYEALLKGGVSADLYYNLGNAYYRTDNITKAILNYERALLLSPGDADTRFNLQMARSKTIDKITPESEMFFVTWYHSLVNLMSVDAWARTALIALAIAIILALAYLFSDRMWLRKTGFFGALFLLVVFLMSNLFAYQQKQKLTHRTGAIIMTNAATVKSTPSKNGTDLFILHEGTRVTITDGSMKGWKEIRVADGKQGWIEVKQLEII
ncbi:MAG: BatD family protein [Prevotella sp.]|nr:BatD family protein [Prevotella sp.]